MEKVSSHTHKVKALDSLGLENYHQQPVNQNISKLLFIMGFLDGSGVKNLPEMQETQV